ncbi:Hpt domain-containing protein [Caulobacter sp. 17J65-9]|uniref:Hpt domain-containing protein n=1 Tax=Caulobacter sp. 17J65-9 TaxID=2709382 RepID=UPI0013CBD42E|nr:Hpt domain-containing protein [Caulobacter sp. 17J65-9]NEX94470.1 Hpt domain-containing protein [Caulobacter sp. 17J65-9]
MARRDLTGAVDFSVLERLAAGDATVVEEVLDLFREQAALWAPLLDTSSPGWRDAAHTVKGASGGIGAHALADACGQAEACSDELAQPALDRVKDALDAALADVAAYLHERALQSLRAS